MKFILFWKTTTKVNVKLDKNTKKWSEKPFKVINCSDDKFTVQQQESLSLFSVEWKLSKSYSRRIYPFCWNIRAILFSHILPNPGKWQRVIFANNNWISIQYWNKIYTGHAANKQSISFSLSLFLFLNSFSSLLSLFVNFFLLRITLFKSCYFISFILFSLMRHFFISICLSVSLSVSFSFCFFLLFPPSCLSLFLHSLSLSHTNQHPF